jgi:DNA-binding response OmpR family regulator
VVERLRDPQGQNPASATILLADDDRVITRIVSTKLVGVGHSVSVAADGREALDRLRRGEVPDLLVTDRLMPRMDGIELVREIRADHGLGALPIIMLTSMGGEQDVIEGLEAGVDDYVIKPFSPDELAARVRMVLWRAGRRRHG